MGKRIKNKYFSYYFYLPIMKKILGVDPINLWVYIITDQSQSYRCAIYSCQFYHILRVKHTHLIYRFILWMATKKIKTMLLSDKKYVWHGIGKLCFLFPLTDGTGEYMPVIYLYLNYPNDHPSTGLILYLKWLKIMGIQQLEARCIYIRA
jgi:hypothetical protein